MKWDGLFHAAVWLVTLAGVYLLLEDARRGGPLPAAGPFTGQLYDWLFLAAGGAGFILLGWALARRGGVGSRWSAVGAGSTPGR